MNKKIDDIRQPNQTISRRQPVNSKRSRGLISQPDIFHWTRSGLRFFKRPSLFPMPRKSILVFIPLLLIGIAFLLLVPDKTERDDTASNTEDVERANMVRQAVVQEDAKLAVDYTFNLKMIINNQPQAIPANYGKTEDGNRIFNAGSANGDIRVQSSAKDQYTLNDFFALWGGQLNSQCLLNHCLAGGQGSLTMTVNGNNNSEFEKYVIKPDDKIVITFDAQK